MRSVLLALLVLAPLPAQVVTATGAVTSTLTSSGVDCFSQTYWSEQVPVGPLPPGGASMSHCTWATSPSSLVLTASCTAGVCTFTGQPGYCSFGGAVTMTLTAPFDVAVEITASGGSGAGGASGASGATSLYVGGQLAAYTSVNGTAPLSGSTVVVVGPSGVDVELVHSSSLNTSQLGYSLLLTYCTVTWAPLDAAAVTSVPGGCAPPTATPLFVETGLPHVGGSIEADLLQAQGPSPLGFVMFGLEQALIPLASIGMPGCDALQTEFFSLVAQPTGPNELHISVPIPNQPWLVGLQLYSQAFTQALGVNPRQLVSGNGLVWRIGS